MYTKYILIQNDGEIESNSFELIGASTKRNEAGKIGFFGSGLKYSIAYLMRQNIGFKVFSGEQELVFTTIPEMLKEQSFDRICINGKPTSYTVTMGPTWKEDWFVLREIYCNALDEGSCQLVKETDMVNSVAGKTRIYVELTEPLKKVINNWDAYFLDEREPIFIAKKAYTCFLGTEDSTGDYITEQDLSVYPKTEGVLFRRGIRVYKKTSWLFDYAAHYVNINEDRTAKSSAALSYAIADMAAHFSNESWLKTILRSKDESGTEYSEITINGTDGGASDKWVQFSKDNLLVIYEVSAKYATEISETKKEVFFIPSLFAKRLKKNVPDVLILGMGKAIDDTYLSDVEMTPKMNFLLKEVLASLKEMNYQVNYEIKAVDFDDDRIMGKADMEKKEILIAQKTFDMGRREIAMTIMEENEHLISGKEDETRAFQTHIFSQWLKTMEDTNGLFL